MNHHWLGQYLKMFCHALEFFRREWRTHMVLNRQMSYSKPGIPIGVQQTSVNRIIIQAQVLRIQQTKNRPHSDFRCRPNPVLD